MPIAAADTTSDKKAALLGCLFAWLLPNYLFSCYNTSEVIPVHKKVFVLFLLLIFLLCGCLAPSYEETVIDPADADGGLTVHFMDVGQADCILIQQGDHAMLIDAGNSGDGEFIANYLENAGVSRLDYAVGTHPHEDHIGALDTVLQSLPVQTLLMPRIQTNTKTFEDVLDAALEKGLSITAPKAGDTFSLGSATLTAVSDYHNDDLNNASIMLHLRYGGVSFLFTGDAEEDAEQAALATGLPLRSDVLKVGHHGSSTSTSETFLAAVSPAYAVISCGADNDYGHPHKETLAALAGCEVFRTDRQGTVVAVCNGTNITWSTGSLPDAPVAEDVFYVLNTSSNKFHLPTCGGIETMSQKNKAVTYETKQQLLDKGYSPCGNCKP